MFKRALRAIVTLATAVALAAPAAVAQAAPPPDPEPTAPTVLRAVRVPVLYDVDYQERRGYDRLIFKFRRGDAPDVTARYVRRLVEDPSGRIIRLPGRAYLLLTFDEARASILRRTQFIDLDEVRAYRLLGDFEGVVTVGLGLRERAPYRIRELDDRIIVDVFDDDDVLRPVPIRTLP